MAAPAYLVASRQGIYLVRREGWRLLVQGQYFGIACAGREVFAFRHEAADSDKGPLTGRVVRFAWEGGGLAERGVVASGLDHNCHQLDVFDGAFFLVDTLDQSIREYDASWKPVAVHRILPPADREGPDHAHLNSIAGDAATVRVMLHNGRRDRPSEIWELDRAFRPRARIVLPCSGCHDIVPMPDGRLLTCLSPRGEIALVPGEAHKIDDLWTRGLVVGAEEIAVGSSLYGKRLGRALLPGFVTFLDPAFRRTGRLYLPAAPTQMRGLDFDPEA